MLDGVWGLKSRVIRGLRGCEHLWGCEHLGVNTCGGENTTLAAPLFPLFPRFSSHVGRQIYNRYPPPPSGNRLQHAVCCYPPSPQTLPPPLSGDRLQHAVLLCRGAA